MKPILLIMELINFNARRLDAGLNNYLSINSRFIKMFLRCYWAYCLLQILPQNTQGVLN